MEREPLQQPSQEVIAKVLRRLERLDIHINHEVASVVVAAYEDQLKNNYDMKKHIIELFDFTWKQGESDTEYELLNGYGETIETLKGEDVYAMQAVVAKNKFIHPHSIRKKQIELEACESCGILSHCTKNVVNKHNGKLEAICNNCLVFDEQLRSEGDPSMCAACNKTLCEYNPNNNVRRLHA